MDFIRRDAYVEAWQVNKASAFQLRGIDSKTHFAVVADDEVYLCSKDFAPRLVPNGSWITRDCTTGKMDVYSATDFRNTFIRQRS